MELQALIVEQLEDDGTIRSFKMERRIGQFDLIVAFADEYDEPRDGPFHFHDPEAARHFSRGFAQCRLRRIGSRHFYRKGTAWHVDLAWYGVPTTQNMLSYYALSLPRDAIPVSLEVTDPLDSGREYRRTVTIDDQERRYVIYLECSSRHGRFDFQLSCDFQIDPARFPDSDYRDSMSQQYGRAIDEYRYVLDSRETEKVTQFFVERLDMNEPNINVAGQVGAMGSHAKAQDMTFQQIWHQTQDAIDLPALARELGTLRAAMRKEAAEPSHDKAVAAVAEAEEAANRSDGPSVLRCLKAAGKWAWDVATKIGTSVAADVIKKSIGL